MVVRVYLLRVRVRTEKRNVLKLEEKSFFSFGCKVGVWVDVLFSTLRTSFLL